MFTFFSKMISIKNLCICNLGYTDLYSAHAGLKSLNKCQQFHCTGFLRRSKLVYLGDQKMAFFTQNLNNPMNLFLASKKTGKWI